MVGAMKTHTCDPVPASAGHPVRIESDAWYTDADLRLILRLPGKTLQRARRAGELRHSRRGITTWHRGEWVIDWLSGHEAVDHAR